MERKRKKKVNKEMTREELKRQVSEAGRFFIDEVYTEEGYLKRWFDSQSFLNSANFVRIGFKIKHYNDSVTNWTDNRVLESLKDKAMYGDYCAIDGMLNLLKDIDKVYYDGSKYGDIDPFIDYCWSCWCTRKQIDFAEYEKIRAFYEGRKEIS